MHPVSFICTGTIANMKEQTKNMDNSAKVHGPFGILESQRANWALIFGRLVSKTVLQIWSELSVNVQAS